MADLDLASRVRVALDGIDGITEKRMFGGPCFLLHGNLVAATGSGRLLVRIGRAAVADLPDEPAARPAVMGERVMRDWVHVDPASVDDEALRAWVARALDFTATLPASD
ncbi:TfoX/Sxy family protein [Cellulomonas sp. HZM]|uniref:TfoX/Sxy family protein n=1 Tax=Cellulomonas sp. HZM TaxID=1454010 RepID=UPI000493550A|nr:TfoX/Sxy family protein [Cellulomonas sp. HZM]